jgi:hypothetical protein
MLLGDKSPKALAARWLLRDGWTLVATFQFARANGQEYLPGTVGAGKGEAAVQILHFLPAPQAPPGLGRTQRHFVEKRFDGAAKRLVDFELVRDRHLGNSAVSVTNMVRCFLLRLAGRRGAHCAKVRQQAISRRAISKSERTYEERTNALQRILRQHLLDEVPVSDTFEETGLRPTVFYRWQKESSRTERLPTT